MRLDGIKVRLPGNLHLSNLRETALKMGELGTLEDIAIHDSHTLSFAFVPTNEAGERLATMLKRGAAQIEAVFPADFKAGMTRTAFVLRISWDPVLATAEDRKIIDPFL